MGEPADDALDAAMVQQLRDLDDGRGAILREVIDVFLADAPEAEPGFRRCLTVLLYLLQIDPAGLGPPVSPLELPGATLFFQKTGPHALPRAPLEERFGHDPRALGEVGRNLGGEALPQGDAAFTLRVFPGLQVGVILWQGDEDFPPQVSFTLPSRLEVFWQLDAVLALLEVVVKELLQAAGPLIGC
uniref:DUF3786 domain-containing protein n=1 Tax=Desulfobacca acetoxidans TaxID=60893 RepID=A0A7V4LBV0_9BACT